MKHSSFGERLAFARLVRLWATGSYPGNAELARAVGHTGPWMTKWSGSDTPPTDYRVHRPLADYLGVSEAWLFRGEGEPPRPELWDVWLAERRSGDAAALEAMKAAQRHPRPVAPGEAPTGRVPTRPISRPNVPTKVPKKKGA